MLWGRQTPTRLVGRALTLLEVVVVIVIMAILASLALPRVIALRRSAAYNSTASSFQNFRSSFQMYYGDFEAFPPDNIQGVMPPGMIGYIDVQAWRRGPIIGGLWDWNGINTFPWSTLRQNNISINQGPQPTELWLDFDDFVDDSNLSTGLYRTHNSGGRNLCFTVDP